MYLFLFCFYSGAFFFPSQRLFVVLGYKNKLMASSFFFCLLRPVRLVWILKQNDANIYAGYIFIHTDAACRIAFCVARTHVHALAGIPRRRCAPPRCNACWACMHRFERVSIPCCGRFFFLSCACMLCWFSVACSLSCRPKQVDQNPRTKPNCSKSKP